MRVRKKPVVVEAVQWTGDNLEEIQNFVGEAIVGDDILEPIRVLVIKTLEGNMNAGLGCWIIKGVNGEYYPCRADIFEQTYEIL